MERTDSKPYKSLSSELFVGPADYLAELVCQRKQQKENVGALPIKFWNHPKYKNLYIREVSQARNLLKIYPTIAIIRALEDWKSRYIMSLRNKNLIPIIEEKTRSLSQTKFTEEKIEEVTQVKPLPIKKNILGML